MRRSVLLALIVLIADQSTKVLARAMLRDDVTHAFGPLTLLYTENSGAFLSLGANLPGRWRITIFDGVVAFALVIAAVVLFRNLLKGTADRVALALLIAGGAGNLIDRIRFRGLVTDFLLLSIGPLRTGVFNIADVAITAAVLWLSLSWALERVHRRRWLR